MSLIRQHIYLIGPKAIESLTTLNQLPTKRQVLSRFHYYLSELKKNRTACHRTIEEVLIVWNKAAIPTKQNYHCVGKLEKVHTEWLLLKKNNKRTLSSQKEKESVFSHNLDKLFDIAHMNAFTLINIDEDRTFLKDQRTDRKMIITTEHKEVSQRQARSLKRHNTEKERQQRHVQNSTTNSMVTHKELASYLEWESESSESIDSDDEYTAEYNERKKPKSENRETLKIVTHCVASALDRNKITDREAVRIVIPILSTLGHNPENIAISRSTIHRARRSAREDLASVIKQSYEPKSPLIIHWDSKISLNISGSGTTDRLAVLVSGDSEEKLLGIPKLAESTCEQEAEVVYGMLKQWKLIQNIVGMSFDTTSTNTGCNKGVCVRLEQKIGHEMMWLACRHHIFEIILSKVFEVCFGASTSPDVTFFNNLKTAWTNLNKNNYKILKPNKRTKHFMDKTLSWLTEHNAKRQTQARDDYMELVELTMVVLGKPPDVVHWRAPGPIHHARWMAKIIYTIKIFLFREQLSLTRHEKTQLQRFVQFGVFFYTKSWITAPFAAEAPEGDLNLWLLLDKYSSIDPQISATAKERLERHLWYLSDELVGLALFSDKVSDEDKHSLANAIVSNSCATTRMVRGNAALLNKNSKLCDFANGRSKNLLKFLRIDDEFLRQPPQTWKELDTYLQGKKCVSNLRVVNDTAERGIKLFTDYQKLLTDDEDEKQFLLQVVEQNRKLIPTKSTKASIIKAVSQ